MENNIPPLSRDLIISVDVETTGLMPGPYSMLSLGAVPIIDNIIQYDNTFYRTLKELPKASRDHETMEWWKRFPKQFEEATKDAEEPSVVINEFVTWLDSFKSRRIVFVANPGNFDAAFIFYYLLRYAENVKNNSVKRFQMIDMRTMMAVVFRTSYLEAARSLTPPDWTRLEITHNALEDALQQAEVFIQLSSAIDTITDLNARD